MRMAMHAGLAMVAAACGGISVSDRADGGGTSTDASAADAAGTDAARPDPSADAGVTGCAWSEPSPALFLQVNGPDYEESGTLTADGLTLYFTLFPATTGNGDIFDASREAIDEPFGAPRRITELSSPGQDEHDLDISASGDEIFYTFFEAGEILSARRVSPGGPFGEIESTGHTGFSPSLSGDQLDLYFVDINLNRIVHTSRTAVGQAWSDTPDDVGSAAGYDSVDVSSDEMRILLSRGTDRGEPTVAIATRTSLEEPFDEPVSAGDAFQIDGDIALFKQASWSGDESRIILSFDFGLAQGSSLADLYQSTCE